MTKFEEELFNKVPCKIELTTEAEYKKSTLINHFKNWHSDEEFQKLLDKYNNLNDNFEKEVIKSSKLESQIIGLKEKKAILNIDITSEELAEQIVKELNKNEEHKCTPKCFEKHVIKAIQNDYDSIDSKNRMAKHLFISYWYDNLSAYYPWLESLYMIDGKIYFKSK